MSSFERKRNNEEMAERKATRELQRRRKQIQIPPFNGDFDQNTYLEWAKEMDLIINYHGYTAEKQVQLATAGLCGYALDWWYQLADNRRYLGESQVASWYEMKSVMKKRFVAKKYGQTDLERFKSQSRSSTEHVGTSRYEPKTLYGRETQRKSQLLNTHLGYIECLQSTQFKENLSNMIAQSLTAVVQNQPKRSVPRPTSGVDELSYYQKEPAEKKEAAAKQAEKEQKFESEPTTLCQADNLDNNLKQEKRLTAMCDYVPDQTKKEEGVLEESSTAPDLALCKVDQGDSVKTLACELLLRHVVCIQISLVEHLRVVKGLQQVVFEPGGSLSVSRRSNNNLVQKTVLHKLDLQGLFALEEQDLRSNLFEWREDGVILSICSKNRGGAGGNTSLIRSITDHNKLGRAKQDLVVVKEKPKLESEYGDQCTRPPDQKKTDPRVYGHMSKSRMCVGLNWTEENRFKLNKVEGPAALVDTCTEMSSKLFLWHEKGLQNLVFEPGGSLFMLRFRAMHGNQVMVEVDHLDGSDLRTNPFKGGGDGAILSSLTFKGLEAKEEPAIPWTIARPSGLKWTQEKSNGLTGELIGLIHEVLDREKAMGLDEACIKHGMTMGQHGQVIRNLIDQEMDEMKLVGKEMEWESIHDLEMDSSNRYGREMAWKWKLKNQSWKWNNMSIFIIQVSIRSNLVRPGRRWIEPKQELFEKGLYRPKKWKDKPAWFLFGPRRLATTNMV